MIHNIKIDKYENLILNFNNKSIKFEPYYSTSRSLKMFEKIIASCIRNESFDNFKIKNYNVLPSIYEDLLWKYCFNYVKYESFFSKYLVNNNQKIENNLEWENGLKNYLNFYRGDSIFNIFIINIKKIFFILWIIKLFIQRKQEHIWIDSAIFNDFRYDATKFFDSKKHIPILNRWTSIKSRKKNSFNINECIKNLVSSKCNSYRLWHLAIRVLKPKKIICRDNLFDSYSLLLAAKFSKTEIIGVSHGLASFWHRGIIGSENFNRENNQLRFDKYYAWTPEMVEMIKKDGFLYLPNEIFLCGWLKDIKIKGLRQNNNIKKNYILYPYEWLCNHKYILKNLKNINTLGYKIILKKRPDVKCYDNFKGLDIEIVNEFTDHHYENSLCAIGSTTTILYEYSFMGIPVYIIKNDGFDLFKNIFHHDWIEYKSTKSILENKRKERKQNFISFTKQFIDEFN